MVDESLLDVFGDTCGKLGLRRETILKSTNRCLYEASLCGNATVESLLAENSLNVVLPDTKIRLRHGRITLTRPGAVASSIQLYIDAKGYRFKCDTHYIVDLTTSVVYVITERF